MLNGLELREKVKAKIKQNDKYLLKSYELNVLTYY